MALSTVSGLFGWWWLILPALIALTLYLRPNAARNVAWICLELLVRVINLYQKIRIRYWRYNLPPQAPNISWSDFEYIPHRSHQLVHRDHDRLGPIFYRFISGLGLVFFVATPQGVEEVIKNKKAFPSRGKTGINSIAPNGLLALETGPQWSFHRRLISPLFSEKYLQHYATSIQFYLKALFNKWDPVVAESQSKPIDVQFEMSAITLDIIGHIGFGKKMDASKEGRTSPFFRSAEILMSEALRRTGEPKITWNLPPSRKRAFDWALDLSRKLAKDAVEAEAKLEGELVNMCAQMQQARDSGRGFSDQDIQEEAMTLLAAGHETTSNTLSWALMLLSQNPSTLIPLRAEIDEKVKGDTPTYEEARDLPYTRAVIYEALRFYPTVPHFPRVAAMNTKLMSYDVPKGAYVIVSQSAMCMDPKLWTEPRVFRPERFLQSEDPKSSKPVGIPGGPEYGFIPFGGGARTCIGQRLGLLEAVMILAGLIKRYDFALHTPVKPEDERCDITLGPKNGLWMTLRARHEAV